MLSGEELGKAAYQYWGRFGVPCFPCGDDKRPLLKWRQEATVDEQGLISLFGRFGAQARLIGAAMGERAGIFAVDFDLYKGNNVKEFMQTLMLSGHLPPTRIHETRSGGLHYIYTVAEGDKMPRNSVPHDGVEIRGEGGYIIVPPSKGYKVQDSQAAVDAPAGLLRRISKADTAFKALSVSALTQKVIEGESFHEALVLIAAKMHSRGEKPSAVMEQLTEAMMGSVAANPLHERHDRWAKIMSGKDGELARISASAYKKYNPARDEVDTEGMRAAVKQSGTKDITLGGFFAPKPAGEENFEPGQKREPSLTTSTVQGVDEFPFARSYNASEVGEQDNKTFILHPLIMEGDVLVLSAEPKAGKTLVGMNLALHMASGIPIGDQLTPMNREGATAKISVIYFALEGQGAIRKRVKAWLESQKALTGTALHPDDLHLYVVEMPVNLGSDEAKQELVDKLVRANSFFTNRGWGGLEMVVFDTLTKAMPGKDQNSVEDTSAVFNVIDMMREVGLGSAVMFVHHNNRQSRAPRGSSNILAEPDTILSVKKTDPVVIENEELICHELSVYMARAIEDQVYRFAAKTVEIGVNSQGINEKAPVLEYIEDYAAAPSKTDVTLRRAAAEARKSFYEIIWQSLSDSSGMFLTFTQITRALRESDSAVSFFNQYVNDKSKQGIFNAMKVLLSPEELPTSMEGMSFTVDQEGVKMLLNLGDETGGNHAAQKVTR